MAFGLYVAGYVVLICGLIYAAHLMHMPTHWIVVGVLVMVGMGLMSAVKATSRKI